MRTPILIILLTALISSSSFSQSTQKFIDSGSVNKQFEYLIDNSNKYQEYKVVRLSWLNTLKSNVNDSLRATNSALNASQRRIEDQIGIIDSLNTALANSKSEITRLDNENESFSILGIQFKKSLFRVIFFSIIGGLVLLLVIFIAKYRASNSITQQTRNNLKEVEEEFENHRKIALEREQKVRRQLQDELNKQKPE